MHNSLGFINIAIMKRQWPSKYIVDRRLAIAWRNLCGSMGSGDWMVIQHAARAICDVFYGMELEICNGPINHILVSFMGDRDLCHNSRAQRIVW